MLAGASTVFDIGMYDGADTAYYLDSGHRVVAIEANADLVARAAERFAPQIAERRLSLVHAAITSDGGPVDLAIAGSDLGSSSIFAERIAHKEPAGTVRVPGITLAQLIERHGVPEFLKVDIEGADRLCVLALTAEDRPAYLSFEVGDDFEELLAHVVSIGFARFKVINQMSFREIAHPRCHWWERRTHRLLKNLGYRGPLRVRRSGRSFVIGHSSGPVPWKSDGPWRSLDEIRQAIRTEKAAGWRDWYDLHAAGRE